MFYEYEDSDIENYTDDTTSYTCAPDTDTVIYKLQSASDKIFTWFKNNHMKANSAKCHLLLSSKTPTESLFGGSSINCSKKKAPLGVSIDSELRFDEYISLICNKVSRKINALGRIGNFALLTSCHMGNVV